MLRESCIRLQKLCFCSVEKHYGSLLNVLKWNESPGLHFSHHCLTGNMAYTHLAANLTICLLARSPTAMRACTVNCWWRRTKKHCFPEGKTTNQERSHSINNSKKRNCVFGHFGLKIICCCGQIHYAIYQNLAGSDCLSFAVRQTCPGYDIFCHTCSSKLDFYIPFAFTLALYHPPTIWIYCVGVQAGAKLHIWPSDPGTVVALLKWK